MSIDRILELEREIARLQALQVEALVAVASADRVVDEFVLLDPRSDEERTIRIEDAVREEIAAALKWSPQTAYRRIVTARLLVGPLADAKASLAAGEITMAHVGVLVEAADRLPGRHGVDDDQREAFAAACDALQRRVLPVAKRGTLSMTRAAAKRAVLAIDSEGEQRRRQQARCTRGVHVFDDVDGLSTLVARMATSDAHAVMAVVDSLAHDPAFVTDCRATIGERRVEALAALVVDRPGTVVEARLDVVVDLPTVLGLADNPVELRGAVAEHPDVVRELLAREGITVTMRRLVADPVTGHLLDVGRRAYAVPEALRSFIVARDGTCRFPGCARRASRCQVDHAEAWDDGGPTDRANLGALCVRHHQLKTHGGWDITDSTADGSCSWRSPVGRAYRREAAVALPPPDPDPPPF